MITASAFAESASVPYTMPAALPPTCVVALAEPAARTYLTRGLARFGHPISSATNGVELVERIASAVLDDEPSARPGLIVADAILPGCTGLSVLAGIRALGWMTPVILLTESGDVDSRREALAQLVTCVFSEPYELSALIAFARAILAPSPRRCRRPAGSPAYSRLIH